VTICKSIFVFGGLFLFGGLISRKFAMRNVKVGTRREQDTIIMMVFARLEFHPLIPCIPIYMGIATAAFGK